MKAVSRLTRLFQKAVRRCKRGRDALLYDAAWKCGGISPVWIGSPSGGACVNMESIGQAGIVYSFGIACEISFDRDILSRTGCRVYGFDPDPRSEAWIQRQDIWVPPGFQFTRAALDSSTGVRPFFLADIHRMSGSLTVGLYEDSVNAQCYSLSDIMNLFGHTWVDYIKLDIEGAEYEVLKSWLTEFDTLPVGQLWVEFHPDGTRYAETSSMDVVRSLHRIGMIPAYRNSLRHPNNYLLIHRKLRSGGTASVGIARE